MSKLDFKAGMIGMNFKMNENEVKIVDKLNNLYFLKSVFGEYYTTSYQAFDETS